MPTLKLRILQNKSEVKWKQQVGVTGNTGASGLRGGKAAPLETNINLLSKNIYIQSHVQAHF